MAVAKKCDICGSFYDEYNVKNNSEKVNGLMFLNIDHKGNYFTHPTIDCCPVCIRAVQYYIDGLRQAARKASIESDT